MAFLLSRTLRFTAVLILACVFTMTACTQAEVTPAVQTQPASVDSLRYPTPTPRPTPSPTQNQPAAFFQGPLSVAITRPLDNETVQNSPVEISGQADPGTVLTIDDHVILVDNSRAFSLQLALAPGANMIEITASDANENQGFGYLTLYYDPQP